MSGWREKLFEISWRAAILVLPWQTRWYRPAELGGWPWEQGSLVVYAAWIPILATILFGFTPRRDKRLVLPAILALLLIAAGFSTGAPWQPMLVWWVQILLLGFFVWTLFDKKVAVRKLLFWFVTSLLAPTLLGAYQFAQQKAFAASWLGLAAHDPRELGVSVVEWSEFRLLRVYGSFPHPNIFGGWLAAGILAAVHAAGSAQDRFRAYAYALAAAVFSGVLILTFSRSAMLAAALSLAVLGTRSFLHRKSAETNFSFVVLALVCAVLGAGLIGITQLEPLTTRVKAQDRLELISQAERQSSLAEGWEMFKRRPVLGTGANAELFFMAQTARKNSQGKLNAPLESPHDFFLLLLVDFGFVGSLVFILLSVLSLRQLTPRLEFFSWLLPLALFDHYVWSYWSGLALLALVLLLFSRSAPSIDKPAEAA
ncbi:MAG: O-antigen ligase family protein [Patescibacteria group bacterium]